MKNLTLIVTLIATSTSFALKAENYQVKNKPALVVSTTYQTVSKTTYAQPAQVTTQQRNTYIQQQPVEYAQQYVNQTNSYDQNELSYAVRNQSQYHSGRRGDILGEVVEVKRAPKQCEPTVKHEGTNTVLASVVGGAIGNRVGRGNGRKANTVIGALIGGAIANKHNRESRGKVECEGRGYLLTLAYLDDYGQLQYHTVRSDRRESKGTLLNVERD